MKMKTTYPSILAYHLLLLSFILYLLFIQTMNTKAESIRKLPVRGERPPIDIISVPESALETGIIRIKFIRSQEDILEHNAPYSTPEGEVHFGIPSVDQLNALSGVISASRTFEIVLQDDKFTELHHEWGFHLWYDLIIPENADIRSLVLTYSALAEIELSEPVYRKQLIDAGTVAPYSSLPSGNSPLSFTPNDPRFNEQWHYHNTGQLSGTADADIDLPEAWEIIKGNSNVIVAVMDDGIEYTHPDLAANMWPGMGYNFVTNSPLIVPGNHGTHVAGTIAANSNNGAGVAGIAGGDGSGNGVRLMSCQVFSGSSSGGFHLAPVWAADNGAAISQNSWSYTNPGYYEQAVLDAIDYFNLHGGGTVLNGGISIFSAANNSSSQAYYPAYYSGTLSVAATNNNDQKAWYSNYGSWVDISAPGGETNSISGRGVLSTFTSGSYGFQQGTSMACPHVSGVAALILSLIPGFLTPAELQTILLNSADPVDSQNPNYSGLLGSGRLNAYQALLLAQDYIIPNAEFSASARLQCSGSTINFTDETLAQVTSWTWDFPGGNPSSWSGQIPPPIQYAAPGYYSVSLTVSNGTTTSTETKSAYIEIRAVIADFMANTQSLIAGNPVTFTDLTSCSADTWEWSFPGGTPSVYSGATPPPIVYASSGNFDVSLTASKNGVSDSKIIPSYIQVTPSSFNMYSGSITTCDVLFFDSGGPSGNYQNYENRTLTVYPSVAGAASRITFTTFNLQTNYDNLYIYNGPSVTDPLIATFTGTDIPGSVTSSHPTGALTLQFIADCCGNRPGWSAIISCYSAPPVVNFSASNLTPAIGEAVTLQDLSLNLPTTWNWNISPASFNYLNNTDATSKNPQVQFLSAGPYSVSLNASNSSGSSIHSEPDFITVMPATTCIPTYSTGSADGDFISLVKLGGIQNVTGSTPAPFYTDFGNLTAHIVKGTPNILTLAAGVQNNGNNITVWIDYNQNNLFESSEKIGALTLPATPATDSITFFIPENALNGTTRMRVRTARGINDMDPCALYSYGETEDYRVQISPLVYCEPTFESGSQYGNYISLVQLAEINNTTGASPSPYYTYYNADTATLSKGTEYTLTLSAGTYPESNNIIAWIDFDFDGLFEEAEKLGMVSLQAMPETGVITFIVPETAYTGTTRLRLVQATFYYDFGPCESLFTGEAEDYPVYISGSGKSLQLTLFLEGLYSGAGIMNPANNESGPQFSSGIADQVTVEFHNAGNYSIIEHSVSQVNLGINGQLNLPLPGNLTGSYYISIRHRNSIEVSTASPVSFTPGVNTLLLNDPDQVFGGNLLMKNPGEYVIFGGDVNQDSLVDSSDMIETDNDVTNFASGYLPTDVNGDGLVDSTDMIIIENNSSNFVGAIVP